MIRLFRVSFPTSAVALFLSEALLIPTCYVLAASLTLDQPSAIYFWDEGGWLRIAFVTLTILGGVYFQDLYEQYRIASRTVLVEQFCLVLGVTFLLQALLAYARWDI